MMLYLVCVGLLLVSLASAAKPSFRLVPKVIYSDGHIIAYGSDIYYLQYQHYKEPTNNKKYLSFNIAHHWDMILRQNATELKGGFAIEVFSNKGQRNGELCRQKSSENLRDLIESCWGNIALRELTQWEKQQLRKFKDEQNKGTRSYQLIYKQKKITARFTGIDYFQLWDKQMNGANDFSVGVNSLTENKSELKLVGALAEKSFVIENQPAGSQRDCKETDLDLKPESCFGDIQIRKMTIED